ncbi:MAG: polyhydroxyalkanoate synthesis repressor PhaR, partial [Hyphomicrobiaceae bacterium]
NQFANAFGNPAAAFEAYQEQARKNMQMFEQALSMWSPFGPNPSGLKKPETSGAGAEPSQHGAARTGGNAPEGGAGELAELKAQLAAMQQKIEKLTEDRE